MALPDADQAKAALDNGKNAMKEGFTVVEAHAGEIRFEEACRVAREAAAAAAEALAAVSAGLTRAMALCHGLVGDDLRALVDSAKHDLTPAIAIVKEIINVSHNVDTSAMLAMVDKAMKEAHKVLAEAKATLEQLALEASRLAGQMGEVGYLPGQAGEAVGEAAGEAARHLGSIAAAAATMAEKGLQSVGPMPSPRRGSVVEGRVRLRAGLWVRVGGCRDLVRQRLGSELDCGCPLGTQSIKDLLSHSNDLRKGLKSGHSLVIFYVNLVPKQSLVPLGAKAMFAPSHGISAVIESVTTASPDCHKNEKCIMPTLPIFTFYKIFFFADFRPFLGHLRSTITRRRLVQASIRLAP